MFDNLITRITSPTASRRCRNGGGTGGTYYHCSGEAYSDPENDGGVPDALLLWSSPMASGTGRKPRALERRKKGRRTPFVGLRQARSLGRLDGLKEAEKLADYGRLFGGSQPSLVDGRKRDLDRIQDLFPHDFLGLHLSEPATASSTMRPSQHGHGLVKKSFRKKSFGDLSQVEAVSMTALDKSGFGGTSSRSGGGGGGNDSCCDRLFLVEAPCAMSNADLLMGGGSGGSATGSGVSPKSRHLFLFSDMLIVAKPKSGGSAFTLKASVRVSELWIARWPPDNDTGFLIGWPGSPAHNYLVSFCTQAARDSWLHQLQQALTCQMRFEPALTNIKVMYRDPDSGIECSKMLGVGPETSAGDVVRLMVDEPRFINARTNGGSTSANEDSITNSNSHWTYTLFACDRHHAPYPLIGFERPHAIQLARLRRSLAAEEGFDLAHCNTNHRIPSDIVFNLKVNSSLPPIGYPNSSPSANSATLRKTPLKLFRRNGSNHHNAINPRYIFGVPLQRLFSQHNNGLPAVILACLKTLFVRGPHTQGIFRRCASARALKELRERIDSATQSSGHTDTISSAICEDIQTNTPVLLLAALLKEFLRSLPEPLLCGASAHEWLRAANSGCLEMVKDMLVRLLPKENFHLLTHVICILHAIAKRSNYNLMSASNLGVCVGPSLLWESAPNAPLRSLPAFIELLITQSQFLFGSDVVTLLGDVSSDSGAEESDSLHSLGLSLDSSTAELSKDQKSLSRDSGLTLSEDDRDSPSLMNNRSSSSSGSSSTMASSSVPPQHMIGTNRTVMVPINEQLHHHRRPLHQLTHQYHHPQQSRLLNGSSISHLNVNKTSSPSSSSYTTGDGFVTFHRFDWARQAARMGRPMDYSATMPSAGSGAIIPPPEAQPPPAPAPPHSHHVRYGGSLWQLTDADESFTLSTTEGLCGPPVPPRRLCADGGRDQYLRHLLPVHLPPPYRTPPPPPAPRKQQDQHIYATAKMLLVTDMDSESYV